MCSWLKTGPTWVGITITNRSGIGYIHAAKDNIPVSSLLK